MTPEQEQCDHNWSDWARSEDWRSVIELLGDGMTLEHPVECTKCKLKAREVFIYSHRWTDENEEV